MQLTPEQIKELEDFQKLERQKKEEKEMKASLDRIKKVSEANRYWAEEMAKKKGEDEKAKFFRFPRW